MDPLTLALLTSVPKLGLGLYQAIKGYSTDEPTRPTMKTPESVLAATRNAQDQASSVLLPGQSAIEGSIDQSSANMLQNIERMGGDVNMASRLYGQNLGAKTNLGISAAQNYNQNQARLREQLNRQGEYERRNFDYNEALPYQEKTKQISALKGAGLTNTTESVTDMLKSAGIMNLFGGTDNTAGNYGKMQMANNLFQIGNKDKTPYFGDNSAFSMSRGDLMDLFNSLPQD